MRKDKVDNQISIKVAETVKMKMESIIDEKLGQIIKTEKVKKFNNRSESVTMEEYVKDVFENGFNYNNVKNHIAEIAKRLSKDLRDRTDLMFASQIVLKLNEQGLLKEEAAKMGKEFIVPSDAVIVQDDK